MQKEAVEAPIHTINGSDLVLRDTDTTLKLYQSQMEKDTILVHWIGLDDPDDPHNWSGFKKGSLSVIAAFIVLNATFSSSAPSGIIEDMEDYFGFGSEVATLTISVFVAGYGVGPIIWGSLSEQLGRKPVFIISMLLYTAFNIGCALSQNTASIIIFRFLAGACASASQSNAGGVIADLYRARARGIAMCVYSVAPFTGPALGPIVGGWIQTSGASWTWLYWTLSLYSGACMVVVFFIPETYSPILLKRRAEKLRQETGDQRYKTPAELKQVTILHLISTILAKPFRIVWQEPMLQAIILYQSYIFGLLYLLFEAFPIIFQEGHHLSAGVGGLMLCVSISSSFLL
jgi:multidrug resistance protein